MGKGMKNNIIGYFTPSFILISKDDACYENCYLNSKINEPQNFGVCRLVTVYTVYL